MKRLIILSILLIASNCFAQAPEETLPEPIQLARMNVTVLGGGAGGGEEPSCDDCSGDLKLSVRFENNTDITEGDPCGCSDGDYTLTAVDSITFSGTGAKTGSYSAYVADGGKYFKIDITGTTEVNDEEGKLIFWVYIGTWAADAHLFTIYGAENTDEIWCKLASDGTVGNRNYTCTHEGNNTKVTASYTGGNLPLNQLIRWTIQWKVGAAGDDFVIKLDVDDDGSDDAAFDKSGNGIAAMTTGPSEIRIGNYKSVDAVFYIDDFSIYGTSGL